MHACISFGIANISLSSAPFSPQGQVHCEGPNSRLYEFTGRITCDGSGDEKYVWCVCVCACVCVCVCV